MKKILFLFLALLFIAKAKANYYLVYFTNKAPHAKVCLSEMSQAMRSRKGVKLDEKDLAVSTNYCSLIKATCKTYFGASRWLNAVCIKAEPKQVEQLKKFNFVAKIEPIKASKLIPLETAELAPGALLSSNTQLEMLELDRLHKQGYTGKGMKIAVFDNGFTKVDVLGPYKHLYRDGRILQTKNFTDPSRSVYQMGSDGEHGSRVFSVLAALMPPNFVGTAYDASYYLAVTEDMTRESELEEWNWLKAAEWADSLGTDIISTSLGYATNFTIGSDHIYEEMDGKTTIISRAANLAASRGILVVNSAGNEGQNKWRHIIAPADADSCLAVGAVDAWQNYASFSSTGPSFDGRIKPDVAAMGGLTITLLPQGWLKTGQGTSFACPMMSGFAACIWQLNPSLKNMELFQLIKKSGNQAQNPDTFLGYGIPSADSLYYWIKGEQLPARVNIANRLTVYPNPGNGLFEIAWYNYDETVQTTLEIYDSQGKEIYFQAQTFEANYKTYPLDLRMLHLRKGLYYLRIKGIDNVILYENKLVICE
ncbi:MAG: hypothetical protein CFE21_11140 [Bacteroidetes bacterium B1(2017)]|nr:MAG: hypothetical protein CFE21_11140 [Bacteroidetes bacterium B1(2017)]